MSPGIGSARPKQASFPRVSGDEPLQATIMGGVKEFSPRERG